MKYLLTLLLCLSLASCNENSSKAAHSHDDHAEHEHHDHHEHAHEAPNGGVLTDVGDHSASIEWLIEDGQLKLFVFDGCAEKPIRLAQKEVTVKVKAGEEKLLTLQAATNKLTGEKPGDSNTFTITTDLTKEKISDLSVQSVNIQGIDYKNLNLDLE